MVLCAACHFAVDSLPVDPATLREIKRDWTEQGISGAKRINYFLSKYYKAQPYPWSLITPDPVTESVVSWADSLEHHKTFDADIEEGQQRLRGVRNEDEFIRTILWPLFVALDFEDVTILHHNRLREHGKDMVLYKRDLLGSFTVYAVVACCTKIHTTASRTSDSGHYAKIIAQVEKCCDIPWEDINLKRRTYIDKVVIATPSTIAEEATEQFRSWEERNRRQLIFLDFDRLAGMMARLKPKSAQWEPDSKSQFRLSWVKEKVTAELVDQNRQLSNWYHIKVENLGSVLHARNCCCYIESIEDLRAGKQVFSKNEYKNELIWAGTGHTNVDIPRQEKRDIDAILTVHGSGWWVFNERTTSTIYCYPALRDGEYKIRYVLHSDSFPSAVLEVHLVLANDHIELVNQKQTE